MKKKMTGAGQDTEKSRIAFVRTFSISIHIYSKSISNQCTILDTTGSFYCDIQSYLSTDLLNEHVSSPTSFFSSQWTQHSLHR